MLPGSKDSVCMLDVGAREVRDARLEGCKSNDNLVMEVSE